MPGPLFARAAGLPPRSTRSRTFQAGGRLSRLPAYDANPARRSGRAGPEAGGGSTHDGPFGLNSLQKPVDGVRPGRRAGLGRPPRRGAVRNPGWGGRHGRPGLVSRLVDHHRHRRRQPGARWRRLRPVRSGHIPAERENNAYQQRADGRGESRPTADAAEPSRSRSPMHSISPWHGNGEYHHAEARRAASSVSKAARSPGPAGARAASGSRITARRKPGPPCLH